MHFITVNYLFKRIVNTIEKNGINSKILMFIYRRLRFFFFCSLLPSKLYFIYSVENRSKNQRDFLVSIK